MAKPPPSEDGPEVRRGRYSAPALSKGLDILELLAAQASGLKQSEIAKSLDRSVPEIFRMLAVLEDRGYVALDAASDRYALTPKLFALSHRHPPVQRLTREAGAVMEELALSLNQSLHLAILHGTDILVIAQTDPPVNDVTSVRLGARVPLLLTASGGALVHRLPEARLSELVARIPERTPELRIRLDDHISQCRAEGYCESASMVIAGVHNVSVPIIDHSGAVVAALTVPYIRRLNRPDDPDRAAVRDALRSAGHRISAALGASDTAG
ncbi:IclR family transcriptional regulator [Oceanomicrobium pacificus]|uniref:Helix-turn-helix domain-containing protein n=1 Tax=Oceanomicrobium pacificus TaxID=2692916 RepID=A0A6B0TU65_9RHOB|nr:IclR family transcriptional regulator [Oceanomicrobium pacificus]MXU65188.1 helix-turn-helix domain-containing protein [Oceanomicrobium pacificus]